jgi:hypothetical protein
MFGCAVLFVSGWYGGVLVKLQGSREAGLRLAGAEAFPFADERTCDHGEERTSIWRIATW